MSSKNLIITVVVILILAAGYYFLSSKNTANVSTQQVSTEAPSPTPQAASEGAMMEKETIVKITSTGFSLKSVTIKVGESVTWQNGDSSSHTVNSDTHPTHTLFPILNQVGLIKSGEIKSVKFSAVGAYTYHDHLNPSLTGSVTVE